MKVKKMLCLIITVALISALLLCSCGQTSEKENANLPAINTLNIGKDYTDIEANLTFLTFRTDIMDKLNGLATEFNKIYPGIHVTYQGVSDYETSVITYLNSNTDWGDIMMIPLGIEKDVVTEYFVPLGESEDLSKIYNFTSAWDYDGKIYGLASTGNANGILYNKRIFEEAGIDGIPKTPDDFMEALRLIKENTDAIPLYTNYADEWPMSSWDAYIGISATGLANYMNQIMVHTQNPFIKTENGTGPYAVYKILYDAVSEKLTEDDYTTTSEPLSYQMLNEGKIGCLVFSSWAIVQAQGAGDCPQDIGFMPFPISIDGKQYVSISGDYSYGINVKSTTEEKIASMLYIKWLVEESGYAYSEGGLSVSKAGENPDYYDVLKDCVVLEDEPALEGEELYFDQLNSESGLMINANGNAKVQGIVEHAFIGDQSFDSIMEEWNAAWSQAQNKLGIQAE